MSNPTSIQTIASYLGKTPEAAMSRTHSALFAIVGSLCLFGSSAADDGSATGNFLPAWDAVCGIGRDVAQGCDAVRARTIVDASKYPWSAIGRINFAGRRTRMHCTGALISERLVLTAAHCLFDDIRKQWLRPPTIHFLAGYQRGSQLAHSTAVRYAVSHSYDTQSRNHQYDPTDDWALVELREPIGADTGYLGWSKLDGSKLEHALRSGKTIGLAGYPALRQHVMSVDTKCGGAFFREAEAGDLIIHRCAAAQGDSGGPVLLLENGTATIVAINSGIAKVERNVVWISTPITSFYKKILESLGGNPSLEQKGGHIGFSGKPPAR